MMTREPATPRSMAKALRSVALRSVALRSVALRSVALRSVVLGMALTFGPSVALAQPEDAPPLEAEEEPVEDAPPPPASTAEVDSRDKSPAEILFDQGLKDMLAGKYDRACPALAESFRLDPAPGALFTLAECELGRGRLATAQTHYRDYLDRVDRMADEGKERQQQRVDVANEKLAELEQKVPKLTLRLPADAPDDLVIKRNGDLIAPAMLGRPLPVDPGEYTITVEGPDRRTTEQRIAVAEGGSEELMLLVGRQGDAPLHPMQIGAIVAGSVGLAALVGGTIAGAVAISKKGTIEDECNDQRQCTPAGLDAVDAGQAAGTASTVLLVIAGVGVGAAVTLWLLTPDEDTPPGDDAPTKGNSPYGVSSVGLELAPRPDGATLGLTLTF